MTCKMPEFMKSPSYRAFYDPEGNRIRDGAPEELKMAFSEWMRKHEEYAKLGEDDIGLEKRKMPDDATDEFKKDFAQWMRMEEERKTAVQPLTA